jgi:GGDEF domain-containing protein
MFLSLKKSLDPHHGNRQAEALLRTLHMLLGALRVHMVEAGADSRDRFKTEIHGYSESLTVDSSPDDILVTAGSLVQVIEDYSADARKRIRSQQHDWQQMVSLLAETIAAASLSGHAAMEDLKALTVKLEHATPYSDLTALREQLHDCLVALRHESEADAHAVASAPVPSHPVKLESVNNALELLPRLAVEGALEEARQTPGAFIAILPIDRFAVFQSRFGAEIAEDIFQFFLMQLRSRLLPTDQIFFWSDGVILAIVQRPFNLDSVRAEFARFATHKLEHTVSLGGGRSILLGITSNLAVFGADEGRSTLQLIRKIDTFLLAQAHNGN